MWCFLIVFRNKSKKMVAERQKQTALPERRAPIFSEQADFLGFVY